MIGPPLSQLEAWKKTRLPACFACLTTSQNQEEVCVCWGWGVDSNLLPFLIDTPFFS